MVATVDVGDDRDVGVVSSNGRGHDFRQGMGRRVVGALGMEQRRMGNGQQQLMRGKRSSMGNGQQQKGMDVR